jgi:hypothetical protein
LLVELLAAEEEELQESQDILVPETVPTPTMTAMDLIVARDRAVVMLNKANPIATSQSTGAASSYHTHDVNDDADPEGTGDIDVDDDVTEGDNGDADTHINGDPFCDAATGDDDESSDGDADPVHPYVFSGSDAVVETFYLYGQVHNDPKRKIISQEGRETLFTWITRH